MTPTATSWCLAPDVSVADKCAQDLPRGSRRCTEQRQHARRVDERERLRQSARGREAAAEPLIRPFAQARAEGIARDVAEGRQELLIVLHALRPVAGAQEVPQPLMAIIECLAVSGVEEVHAERKRF